MASVIDFIAKNAIPIGLPPPYCALQIITYALYIYCICTTVHYYNIYPFSFTFPSCPNEPSGISILTVHSNGVYHTAAIFLKIFKIPQITVFSTHQVPLSFIILYYLKLTERISQDVLLSLIENHCNSLNCSAR